jgi:hypothetical protein
VRLIFCYDKKYSLTQEADFLNHSDKTALEVKLDYKELTFLRDKSRMTGYQQLVIGLN